MDSQRLLARLLTPVRPLSPLPAPTTARLNGLALPFPFTFYGNVYNTVNVPTNGNILFLLATVTFGNTASNTALPHAEDMQRRGIGYATSLVRQASLVSRQQSGANDEAHRGTHCTFGFRHRVGFCYPWLPRPNAIAAPNWRRLASNRAGSQRNLAGQLSHEPVWLSQIGFDLAAPMTGEAS